VFAVVTEVLSPLRYVGRPKTFHLTLASFFFTIIFHLLIVGLALFRAGCLFAARRRELGKPNYLLGDRPDRAGSA